MIGRPVREPRTARPGLGVVSPMPAVCASISEVVAFALRYPKHRGGPDEHRAEHRRRPRIRPLEPPYDPTSAETLRRMMPAGRRAAEALSHRRAQPRVLERFRTIGAYMLNFGRVEPADREVAAPPHLRPVRVRVRMGRPRGRVRAPPRHCRRSSSRPPCMGGADDRCGRTRQSPAGAARRRAARHRDRVRRTVDELGVELGPGAAGRADRVAGFYHLVSFTANAAGVELEA